MLQKTHFFVLIETSWKAHCPVPDPEHFPGALSDYCLYLEG